MKLILIFGFDGLRIQQYLNQLFQIRQNAQIRQSAKFEFYSGGEIYVAAKFTWWRNFRRWGILGGDEF